MHDSKDSKIIRMKQMWDFFETIENRWIWSSIKIISVLIRLWNIFERWILKCESWYKMLVEIYLSNYEQFKFTLNEMEIKWNSSISVTSLLSRTVSISQIVYSMINKLKFFLLISRFSNEYINTLRRKNT